MPKFDSTEPEYSDNFSVDSIPKIDRDEATVMNLEGEYPDKEKVMNLQMEYQENKEKVNQTDVTTWLSLIERAVELFQTITDITLKKKIVYLILQCDSILLNNFAESSEELQKIVADQITDDAIWYDFINQATDLFEIVSTENNADNPDIKDVIFDFILKCSYILLIKDELSYLEALKIGCNIFKLIMKNLRLAYSDAKQKKIYASAEEVITTWEPIKKEAEHTSVLHFRLESLLNKTKSYIEKRDTWAPKTSSLQEIELKRQFTDFNNSVTTDSIETILLTIPIKQEFQLKKLEYRLKSGDSSEVGLHLTSEDLARRRMARSMKRHPETENKTDPETEGGRNTKKYRRRNKRKTKYHRRKTKRYTKKRNMRY